MKKTILLGASLILILASCKKDETATPVLVPTPVATNVPVQLYPTPIVKIGLNIHVRSSSVNGTARVAGLSGATVVAKQNGKSYTATTDESGIASFTDLTEGVVSYYVSQQGFAKINSSTKLSYSGTPNVSGTGGNTTGNGSVTVNNTQTSSSSVDVILPKLGSSVAGVVMGDLDGDGPANATVIPSGTIVLTFDNAAVEPNVYKATIASGGIYSFSNLPENLAFTLSTENINATNPASASTPTYLTNLMYAGADKGTTPHVGQTNYRGIVTLK